MKGYLYVLLAAFLLALGLGGCGKEQIDSAYHLYYLDLTETVIRSVPYEPESGKANELVKELINAGNTLPKNEDYRLLLPDHTEIRSYTLEDGVLTLNIGKEYLEMKRTREVLVRAGLVRTFVQVPEIDRVVILIEGEPLRDSEGAEIGAMTADSFVENSGKEIYQYQYANLTLYFTNAAGDRLVMENRRVPYSSNIPLERVVVLQLIKGPQEKGHYPVLPETLNVLGVTTSEKITYVNVDKIFTDTVLNVSEAIPIYAVVDSITANCKVERCSFPSTGKVMSYSAKV